MGSMFIFHGNLTLLGFVVVLVYVVVVVLIIGVIHIVFSCGQ